MEESIPIPMRGMAMCMKWCSSWLFASSWRPSRSLSKTSWGTLHPHPLRSANRVSRKWASRSWARGSKGRRIARALVLAGWPAANSNWAACKSFKFLWKYVNKKKNSWNCAVSRLRLYNLTRKQGKENCSCQLNWFKLQIDLQAEKCKK